MAGHRRASPLTVTLAGGERVVPDPVPTLRPKNGLRLVLHHHESD